MALKEKVLRIKEIADMVLLFKCKKILSPNLGSIEQIAYELYLFSVTLSSEKFISRKQRLQKYLNSQTNSSCKHLLR